MKKYVNNQKAPEGYVFVKEGSLDEMADNIKSISTAVKRFHAPGRLNRDALTVLIKEATRYTGNVIQEKDIDRVLIALSQLENRFICVVKK